MAGAYVQSNHNRASGATSLDVTLTGVVAGNTLVFVGTKYKDPLAANQFTSVSGGGATWARRSEAQTGGGAHIRIEIWVGVGGTGGNITATMDPGTSGDIAAILFELSGLDASTPFDTQAAAVGSSTDPESGATATLAQADSFKIMGACHETGTVSFNPRAGDGDTEVTGEEDGNTGMVVVGAYQVLSATTAINGRWTLGSSANWCAAVIALKAAVGGGGGNTVSLTSGLMGGRLTTGLLGKNGERLDASNRRHNVPQIWRPRRHRLVSGWRQHRHLLDERQFHL